MTETGDTEVDCIERLKRAAHVIDDARTLVETAVAAMDDMASRLLAMERRARAAELRAEDLADQNIDLKLRLAQHETATQPPADA